MNKIIPILLLLCFPELIPAQNLVLNSGFEANTLCSVTDSSIHQNVFSRQRTPLDNWIINDVIYRNACATHYYKFRNTPLEEKYLVYKGAHTGNGYLELGFNYAITTINYTSYSNSFSWAKTTLSEPLQKGKKYLVEMFVRLDSNSTVCQNDFGFDFFDHSDSLLNSQPFSSRRLERADADNKNISSLYLDNTSQWIKVKAVYIARGGETMLQIGGIRTAVATREVNDKNAFMVKFRKNYEEKSKHYIRKAKAKEINKMAEAEFRNQRKAVYHLDDVSVTLITKE
ncbi:MAG: hypothetical protein MUC87_11325 [Bacteroidia bacterium]|jgi:hypothetical protein|nr:hypothetical protein [Bacteroidia bacterium]